MIPVFLAHVIQFIREAEEAEQSSSAPRETKEINRSRSEELITSLRATCAQLVQIVIFVNPLDVDHDANSITPPPAPTTAPATAPATATAAAAAAAAAAAVAVAVAAAGGAAPLTGATAPLAPVNWSLARQITARLGHVFVSIVDTFVGREIHVMNPNQFPQISKHKSQETLTAVMNGLAPLCLAFHSHINIHIDMLDSDGSVEERQVSFSGQIGHQLADVAGAGRGPPGPGHPRRRLPLRPPPPPPLRPPPRPLRPLLLGRYHPAIRIGTSPSH